MLSEKVRSAIARVTNVSADAEVIAKRLLANSESTSASIDPEVIALRNQIEVLNAQLAELRLTIAAQGDDNEPDEMDDAAEHRFKKTFETTLGNQAFAVVNQIYSEEYISSFPRQVRYLMALCLVNWCTNRKLVPAQMWHDLMVNNGSL